MIPILTLLVGAWFGVPKAKEKLEERKTRGHPSELGAPLPDPSNSVSPSDALTVLITGMREDLVSAREELDKYRAQGLLDAATIARLNAELDDSEEHVGRLESALERARHELAIRTQDYELAKRQIEHINEELTSLRRRREPMNADDQEL